MTKTKLLLPIKWILNFIRWFSLGLYVTFEFFLFLIIDIFKYMVKGILFCIMFVPNKIKNI